MARNTSVTLGEHFDEFVPKIIQQGRFQSVNEVVGRDFEHWKKTSRNWTR